MRLIKGSTIASTLQDADQLCARKLAKLIHCQSERPIHDSVDLKLQVFKFTLGILVMAANEETIDRSSSFGEAIKRHLKINWERGPYNHPRLVGISGPRQLQARPR
jgi:hypothetical protein